MIKLFYFSSLDLMIKVEYAQQVNTLRYASHREMENDERVMVEQYIMVEVAPKTDYYRKHPALFVYLGIDERLKKRLATFLPNEKSESLLGTEEEITVSVKRLINASMRNYYAEKIGELILFARSVLKEDRQHESKLANLKREMTELINAYNLYTDQKVTIDEIIPVELKSSWLGLTEARRHVVPSP
ncbi:MAG: hypothetical protein ONB42_00725 [candidate division KSB1 bacterium]|nr:hypothetical protein [candidate division KSB1 bacterium]